MAKTDPGLVVQPRSGVKSAIAVLYLRGVHIGRGYFDGKLETTDAKAAIELASTLHPVLIAASVGAHETRDVRNDAVHLSQVDPEHLRVAVTAMVRYLDAALPVLGIVPAFFWASPARLTAMRTMLDRARSRRPP